MLTRDRDAETTEVQRPMSYMKPYPRQCEVATCPRSASQIVYNSKREAKGIFCLQHAEQLVDAYNFEGAP